MVKLSFPGKRSILFWAASFCRRGLSFRVPMKKSAGASCGEKRISAVTPWRMKLSLTCSRAILVLSSGCSRLTKRIIIPMRQPRFYCGVLGFVLRKEPDWLLFSLKVEFFLFLSGILPPAGLLLVLFRLFIPYI